MAAGAAIAILGFFVVGAKQFAYSYLHAFMFALSLVLGAWFVVLLHHLFDAMWIVSIRRVVEHIACLAPVMFLLFIPVMLLAKDIYPWMSADPHHDHSLGAKNAYLNPTAWYVRVFVLFGLWTVITWTLRKWSLGQDRDGAAHWTFKARKLSAAGIILFALSLTAAAIDWMKSLEHQWFSTMYGVYYFAGSVWTALATIYVLTAVLKRTGHLRDVVDANTMYDAGKLFFAFTVFYAYINFSQYFLIWNAALPEETFWYVKREQGYWWDIGLVIIFGHFFLPFLLMLRIDAKKSLTLMAPLCAWAWLMHFLDMGFNVLPVHPAYTAGTNLNWVWVSAGCAAFMVGVMATVFLKFFHAHPAYPQRDPRISETMGVYVEPLSEARAHGAK
jgi:hypothetical protein